MGPSNATLGRQVVLESQSAVGAIALQPVLQGWQTLVHFPDVRSEQEMISLGGEKQSLRLLLRKSFLR